jgi:hypothetical protein
MIKVSRQADARVRGHVSSKSQTAGIFDGLTAKPGERQGVRNQFARWFDDDNGPISRRLAAIPNNNNALGINSSAPSAVTMSSWLSPRMTPPIPATSATSAGTKRRLRTAFSILLGEHGNSIHDSVSTCEPYGACCRQPTERNLDHASRDSFRRQYCGGSKSGPASAHPTK